VAEANDNRRSKHARVLRAGDVVPPFSQDAAQANGPENVSKEPTPEPSRQPKHERKGRRRPEAGTDADDAKPVAPQAAAEMPTFDLAEHVLAEHRQMAARRRKAPGQIPTQPKIRSERPAVVAHAVEPPPQDLPELQHVVAEIVARDIQRLCSRPGGSSRA
jgi:hypothetical protein